MATQDTKRTIERDAGVSQKQHSHKWRDRDQVGEGSEIPTIVRQQPRDSVCLHGGDNVRVVYLSVAELLQKREQLLSHERADYLRQYENGTRTGEPER